MPGLDAVDNDHFALQLDPCSTPFYMPGHSVKGSVKCDSSCLSGGTLETRSIKSIRVSLVGQSCTYVMKDGARKAQRFQIMRQTVTLYSTNDETPPASTEGFTELKFELKLPEDMTGEEFDDDGQMIRIPLSPSFHDMGNGANRYVKYSVLATAAITSGGQPFSDRQEISVMSWDPYASQPVLKPSSSSSCPPSEPPVEWTTTWHWGPLGAKRHKRTEFTESPTPDRGADLAKASPCSSCQSTTGSRLLCTQCEPNFMWCWDCASDDTKTHPTDHVLVRIDETGEHEHDKTIHATAKSAVAEVAAALVAQSSQEKKEQHQKEQHQHQPHQASKLKRKSTLKRAGSVSSMSSFAPDTAIVLDLSAEMTYEVSMPKLSNFPQNLDIPIVIRVKISSLLEEDLPALLPTMPWDMESPDVTHFHDGKEGPVLLLNVYLHSRIVGGLTDTELWRWCCWHNLLAESETHSMVKPSYTWSPPEKNDGGKWEQTAVLSSHIRRDLIDNVNPHLGEIPHIQTPILMTRFELVLKHYVAGQEVTVPLSEAPWTSGIYRQDVEREMAATAPADEKPPASEHLSAPALLQPPPLLQLSALLQPPTLLQPPALLTTALSTDSYLYTTEDGVPRSPLITKESPVWDYVFGTV